MTAGESKSFVKQVRKFTNIGQLLVITRKSLQENEWDFFS